jgi:hypothetical protein
MMLWSPESSCRLLWHGIKVPLFLQSQKMFWISKRKIVTIFSCRTWATMGSFHRTHPLSSWFLEVLPATLDYLFLVLLSEALRRESLSSGVTMLCFTTWICGLECLWSHILGLLLSCSKCASLLITDTFWNPTYIFSEKCLTHYLFSNVLLNLKFYVCPHLLPIFGLISIENMVLTNMRDGATVTSCV